MNAPRSNALPTRLTPASHSQLSTLNPQPSLRPRTDPNPRKLICNPKNPGQIGKQTVNSLIHKSNNPTIHHSITPLLTLTTLTTLPRSYDRLSLSVPS